MNFTRFSLLLCAASLLGLSSCDFFEGLQGALKPVVSESLMISIEAPESPQGSGIDIPIDSQVAITAFLAEATLSTQITGAPLSGLITSIDGPFGVIELSETGNGTYTTTSVANADFRYAPNTDYNLVIEVPDESALRQVAIRSPGPSNPTLPAWDDLQDLADYSAGWTIPLGGSFDNAVVLLVDTNGDLVYDNRPQGVADYMDWLLDSEITEVTIPGEVFTSLAAGPYAIGIAPLVKSEAADFDELNSLLSNALIGEMDMQVIQFQ